MSDEWRINKLKQRLAALSAELDQARVELARAERKRDVFRSELWAANKELDWLRRQGAPASSETPVTAAGRAQARVRARSNALDFALSGPDGHAPIRDGALASAWPRLDAPAAGPAARAFSPPLRIATIGDWRSPLGETSEPGLVVGQVGDPQVEAADVLVFPRSENMDFAERAGAAPEALWRRAQEGQVTIVLDSSNEAYRWWPGHSRAMHDFLASRGVDPAHAVHLTQDRLYRPDYEAWCAREGLRPMRIVVFDAFIGRTLQVLKASGRQVFERRLEAFARRPGHRSRRLLSLNFAPRPTKLLLLLRLIRDGLWDQGWLSFGGFANDGEIAKQGKAAVMSRLAGLNGFADEAEALAPYADELEAIGPVLFGMDAGEPSQRLEADELPQYGDSWFTVVTESEMFARPHRITEKPLKPLLNLHPFLVLGNPGSLKLLRGYGFETYSDIFDERYDEETDPRRRFDMVYDQVRKLCALDEAELARMTDQVAEILVFNACWGLEELPRRFSDTIAVEVIDQLRPRSPPAP